MSTSPAIDILRKTGYPNVCSYVTEQDIGLTLYDMDYSWDVGMYRAHLAHLVSRETLNTLRVRWRPFRLIQRGDIRLERIIEVYGDDHMGEISQYVPIEYVRAHPDVAWARHGLSLNGEIRIDDVLGLDLLNAKGRWNWNYLSRTLPMDDIRSHPELKWNKKNLKHNPGYTISDAAL